MSKLTKKLREEKGSMTLEFLMVLPYYLLFFLILWQAVASGIAIMKTQSAVNEAAKLYALTEDRSEAENLAKKELGSSDIMAFRGFDIILHSKGEFEAVLEIDHGLVFIPNKWRSKASVEFAHSVNSKVIK